MKIYGISDTHFGHDKLVTMGDGRPTDFGECMLLATSRLSGDVLIHCGDFCIGNDEKHHIEFMEAAKGFKKKILVKGNHDSKSYSWYLDHGWDFVCEKMELKLFGKNILFTHVPVFVNKDYAHNVHGHLHGKADRHGVGEWYDKDWHRDLAPDIHSFSPVNLERLI